MGPDGRRVGRYRDGEVEQEVAAALGDVEAPNAAFGLPSLLEVERERHDPAEVLDRLLAGDGAESPGIQAEGFDRGQGKQREAVGMGGDRTRSLEEAVDEDDVRARKLVATGDLTVGRTSRDG